MIKKLFFLLTFSMIVYGWEGTIVFEDNFNGNALDLSKWNVVPTCGTEFGPRNLQCYNISNVQVENGHLVITAKEQVQEDKKYTSGFIQQLGKYGYGAFVIKARLARGDHLWPAIWTLNDFNGCRYEEIDIAEYRGQVEEAKAVEQTAFWGRTYAKTQRKDKYAITTFDMSEDFHEFAMLWLRDSLTWYIDEKPYFNVSLTDPYWKENPDHVACDEKSPPFSSEAKIILNLAVGGPFFDNFPPFNPETSPKTWKKPTMEVDYVRIYQVLGNNQLPNQLTNKPANQPSNQGSFVTKIIDKVKEFTPV